MPSTCCLRRLRRMGVRVVYTSRITACPHIADGVSRGWGQKKEFNDNPNWARGTAAAHGARGRGRARNLNGWRRVSRGSGGPRLSRICVCTMWFISDSVVPKSAAPPRGNRVPRPAKIATSFPRAAGVSTRRLRRQVSGALRAPLPIPLRAPPRAWSRSRSRGRERGVCVLT